MKTYTFIHLLIERYVKYLIITSPQSEFLDCVSYRMRLTVPTYYLDIWEGPYTLPLSKQAGDKERVVQRLLVIIIILL